jgi:hypothetical protein
MGISNYIPIGATLPAVFFFGRSNSPAQQKLEGFAKKIADESLSTNDCIFTTTALPDGSLQMDVAVETKATVQQPAHYRLLNVLVSGLHFRLVAKRTVGQTTKLKSEWRRPKVVGAIGALRCVKCRIKY